MQDSLPQSVRKLLGILENIEKVVANSNTKDKAMKESTEKATRKGKQKGTNSNKFCIPKKAKVEKSCMLCQKYGGACGTCYSEYQRYKKRDEKLDSRIAKKGTKKLESDNFAKILGYESSN